MANRAKTERNERIVGLANRRWRYASIARMMKMNVSAVTMVIWRARQRARNDGSDTEGDQADA